MKRTELEKKTKSELFELEAKYERRRATASESRKEILKTRKGIKHVLYECDCCLHAVTNVVEDAGGESEYFVRDCGDKVCRYREDFLRMAEQGEKKIKEMQRNLGMA